MTDHTPTTEEVRDGWAYGNQEVDYDGTPVIALDEAFAQFDRWLADLKRKIAAEALREARDDIAAMADDDLTVIVGDPDDDETWVPVRLEDWLDIRADRIEQGGES